MDSALMKWIMDNDEKWNIICRVDDKRFTEEEARETLEEMAVLAKTDKIYGRVFDALAMIILNQHFHELYPDAGKNEFDKRVGKYL